MKKGLLLSVVASGFIFAGGNIAPVQPVVPAAAPAACDFWGTIGARYEFVKDDASANSWGKRDNTWKTAIVLGVEKDLGYGFGFGAELGAYTDLGLDIATGTKKTAEISQLYVTYKTGNTAIKAGRQTLPKTLSPWAWSDRTVGVVDTAFNGVVVVNTDIANTTLVGAWIASSSNNGKSTQINGSNKGLFMLAAEYTGVANTTFDLSTYYVPKNGTNVAMYSTWASVKTKVSNVDLGLQAAYAKSKGSKATFGVAAYAGTQIDAFDAKFTLAYIKDGATPLNLGGTSGFWGNVGYANSSFGGDIVNATDGAKQKIAKLDLGYKLPSNYGKIYGGVAYDKVSGSTVLDKAIAARLGYSFKVSGVDAKIEYRYTKKTMVSGATNKINKVRVEGIYKF